MKRVVITGANGYLASLVRLYNRDQYKFVCISHRDVDFAKPREVAEFFSGLDFDILFHTAANAVTASCENDPEGTHLVNCDSAIEIARVCRKKDRRMLFISTEQVFNGKTKPGPFSEAETPCSVSNYGAQKAEVDAWLHENMEDYVTLRLSWMFGMALPHVKPSPGIVTNTLKALRAKTPTTFTVNEKRCMTYAQNLADQFEKICDLPSGTYHFASANDLCTHECARLVARRFGYSDDDIARYILPDTERYEDRFRDFRLCSSKIQAEGIQLGTFEDNLDRCAQDFGWV